MIRRWYYRRHANFRTWLRWQVLTKGTAATVTVVFFLAAYVLSGVLLLAFEWAWLGLLFGMLVAALLHFWADS